MKREKFTLIVFMFLLVSMSIAENNKKEVQSSKGKQNIDIISQIMAKIIPREGQKTSYGIPLSLKNTEKFRRYYENINLTLEQKKIRDDALYSIPATCCPNKPMSTCCCICNLARSVWGLSNYLITMKGYDSKQIRKEALLWLHFIREEHYIKEELEHRGIELSTLGLTPEQPSCYTRRCNLTFKDGGCGGMR